VRLLGSTTLLLLKFDSLGATLLLLKFDSPGELWRERLENVIVRQHSILDRETRTAISVYAVRTETRSDRPLIHPVFPRLREEMISDLNANLPPSEIDSATFALNEFNALNSEIVKRLEIQYQFIALTLIVAGTFLSLGSQTNTNPVVLLVYPIIALFLAIGWQQNAIVIRQLGLYIRDRIESRVAGGGWESYKKSMSLISQRNLTTLFTRGTFIGTQLVAVVIALPRLVFSGLEIVMLTIDVIAVMITFGVIRRPLFTNPQEHTLENQQQSPRLHSNR